MMNNRAHDIAICEATADDAAELFAICSVAFGSSDPAWKAYFPQHWTAHGREAGAERFLKSMRDDGHATYHKAIDMTSGGIVGFSIWTVYDERELQIPTDLPSSTYWPSALEAEHGHAIMANLMARRRRHIQSYANKIIHLNTLAVLPTHQRRGIGTKLMEWGVQRAEQLSFPCFVEATPSGKALYRRHGFEVEEEVTPDLPAKFADREPGCYSFMVRPRPACDG